MKVTNTEPTKSFWIIANISFILYLLGVTAYLGKAFMTKELRGILPENELSFIENTPAWATAAFAIAVWSGVFASVLLLLKRKIAITGFVVSLLGILTQFFYNFFIENSIEIYGATSVIIPITTITFSIFIIWYSKKCADDGILR